MNLTYEFEADVGPVVLTIAIEYDFLPGEAGDYWNPPVTDSVEICGVYVTSVSGGTYDLTPDEIDIGWLNDLNELTWRWVEAHNLEEDLLEYARCQD